jgi:hypothetical protein
MARYISDLVGTLQKYFSTEGGVVLKPFASQDVDIPESDYVLLYVRPDGTIHAVDSNGQTALIGPLAFEGTGGIVTTAIGNTWVIDGSAINGVAPQTVARIKGTGYFTTDGFIIEHNAGTVNHYTRVSPAGTDDFDEEAIASIGDLFIEIGINQDIVHNTGGPDAFGVGFYWEVSYSAEQESRYTSVRGLAEFSVSGTELSHNLGTIDHFTSLSVSNLEYTDYDIASIGNVYIKVGINSDFVYATGGDRINGIPFNWESTREVPEGTEYSTDTIMRGVGTLTSSGASFTHNLGLDHYSSAILAGPPAYSEYYTASQGKIYIEIGELQDKVYHTGGAQADGLPFYWEASASGTYVHGYVTFEQLLTVSGAIVSYVDQQILNITNLIPSVTVSGNLMGSGIFDYSNGYAISHNLGTAAHYVSITPADVGEFNEYIIASLGNVYVRKGLNEDIVYHTGGSRADGLKFDWEIIRHGLKMIEDG